MTIARLLCCLLLSVGPCLADGGVVIARQTLDGLDFTVFASPVPLRAGPVDVSVLVQDMATGQPVLDAQVDVSWSSTSSQSADWMPPCCSMTHGADAIRATRGHSQNKFLYSAMVPVSVEGTSKLVIHTQAGDREALVSCDITADPPRPPALAYWPLLALPPFVILGFVLHQGLTNKRLTKRKIP